MKQKRWNHNLHHHPFILAAAPDSCTYALDVGCGEGVLTRDLCAVAAHVVGLDRHASSIALARAQGGDRIAYVLGDVLSAPLAPGSFDRVTEVQQWNALLDYIGMARMVGASRATLGTVSFWVTRKWLGDRSPAAPYITATLVKGGAMADSLRVTLEIGPKRKKVVAVAPDWPGLARGATTEQAALDRLRSYMPRYAPVTNLAGMGAAFTTITDLDVVEHYPGRGSTDFWGISFAFSSIDQQALSSESLERELRLMRACWTFFDAVRRRVSAELQKGPRGGGRDRDQIVRHTLSTEKDWAKMIGVDTPDDELLTEEGLQRHRDAYCDAIRDYHAQDKMAGKQAKWPLRYLIRHTAFHTMDHAWEMEDKDLTGT